MADGEGVRGERIMAKRICYDVISYGEWTRPRMQNFREQCCDCGLIHRLDFRIVDGKIEFRTRRDDRATAAARRAYNFTPNDHGPTALQMVLMLLAIFSSERPPT